MGVFVFGVCRAVAFMSLLLLVLLLLVLLVLLELLVLLLLLFVSSLACMRCAVAFAMLSGAHAFAFGFVAWGECCCLFVALWLMI